MAFIIAIHIVACVLLIIMILIQAGRGGGLVEGFTNIESMFGTRTNTFLTRTTAIFSVLFFITCLSLAILSARQSKSIMHKAAKNMPAAAQTTSVKPEQTTQQPIEKATPQQTEQATPVAATEEKTQTTPDASKAK